MKVSICSLTLTVFLVGSVLNAQEYIPKEADIKHFWETKTVIVLEDNPICEYNLTIKDIAPNEWTVTPWEFKEWKEIEPLRKDKSLSFLVLNKVTFENDKTNARYLFISLLLGGDAKNIATMPDLCSIPLAYYGANEDTYTYKIGIFLRFMQNHAKLLKEDPKMATKNLLSYYNKNVQKIEGKTLYLLAEELEKDVNTEAKIKKVYPGAVKIVTKEDIEKAISDKDDNVVFLHKVGPGKKTDNARVYKALVGAGDAQLYFFDYHKISSKTPDGFLAADFKKLAKKN